MKAIFESETEVFSVMIADAPVSWPIINSPTVNSLIVEETLVIDCKVSVGAEGLDVPADSKIPWIWITSGALSEIFSSWTLVPKG